MIHLALWLASALFLLWVAACVWEMIVAVVEARPSSEDHLERSRREAERLRELVDTWRPMGDVYEELYRQEVAAYRAEAQHAPAGPPVV